MFKDLLERPTAPGEAVTYADVVHSEGTLVPVQLEQRSDAARCRDLLRAAGAFAVSTLPQEDGMSSSEPTGT